MISVRCRRRAPSPIVWAGDGCRLKPAVQIELNFSDPYAVGNARRDCNSSGDRGTRGWRNTGDDGRRWLVDGEDGRVHYRAGGSCDGRPARGNAAGQALVAGYVADGGHACGRRTPAYRGGQVLRTTVAECAGCSELLTITPHDRRGRRRHSKGN